MKHVAIGTAAGVVTTAFALFIVYYAGEDLLERTIPHAYFLVVAVTAGIMVGYIAHGKLQGTL